MILDQHRDAEVADRAGMRREIQAIEMDHIRGFTGDRRGQAARQQGQVGTPAQPGLGG